MIIYQTRNSGFHLKFTLCTVDFRLSERFPGSFQNLPAVSPWKNLCRINETRILRKRCQVREWPVSFSRNFALGKSSCLFNVAGRWYAPSKKSCFSVINLRKNLSKKTCSLCWKKKPLLLDGSTYQLRNASSFLHQLNGRKLRVPKAGKGNTRRLKSTIHFSKCLLI